MNATYLRSSSVAVGAAALMIMGTTGCVATRKYTRQQVAPVEARVTTTEKKTSDNASAINELENGLSRTDERAQDAQNKAKAAQDAADAAARSAGEAGNRADQARQVAENTGNRLGEVVENLDNYQLVTTENVLFNFGKATLTKAAKEQLDQAVGNVQNAKNYILEVQGFTDRTGNRDANITLSERRADAVVRYLTAQHQVPLRKIHVLGQGVDPDQKDRSRAARKEARRVEVKMFALNLGGPARQGSQAMNQGSTPDTTRNRVTDSGNGAKPNPNYSTPSSANPNSTNPTPATPPNQ